MNIALISLIGLCIAIIVSGVSRLNVGILAMSLAWLVSPLSTLGAMCIAGAAAHENRNRLFQRLLIYGLAMAVVAALVCYVFFGLLW
jgi:hypothetical protein